MPPKTKTPAKIAAPFRIPGGPPAHIMVVRSIDQHANKPPLAAVIDPNAHVEILVGAVRYRIDVQDGYLRISGTDHGILVEPVGANTIYVKAKAWK